MARIIGIYGLVSGLVIIFGIILTLLLGADHQSGPPSPLLGYLIMLVALSTILVGVKQYRDQTLGGVIKFTTGLMLGLGIALVASIAYTLVWEVYLYLTHYSFMDHYIEATLAARRAAGVTGPAYQQAVAEMETMRRQYANPLFRLPMTFTEIFPVGLLISLVSAALLRNPRVLPARSRAASTGG